MDYNIRGWNGGSNLHPYKRSEGSLVVSVSGPYESSAVPQLSAAREVTRGCGERGAGEAYIRLYPHSLAAASQPQQHQQPQLCPRGSGQMHKLNTQ